MSHLTLPRILWWQIRICGTLTLRRVPWVDLERRIGESQGSGGRQSQCGPGAKPRQGVWVLRSRRTGKQIGNHFKAHGHVTWIQGHSRSSTVKNGSSVWNSSKFKQSWESYRVTMSFLWYCESLKRFWWKLLHADVLCGPKRYVVEANLVVSTGHTMLRNITWPDPDESQSTIVVRHGPSQQFQLDPQVTVRV